MRTVEGDAVIPLSSTAAVEMDFCFVCVSLCVLRMLIWKSYVSYLTEMCTERKIFEVGVLKGC